MDNKGDQYLIQPVQVDEESKSITNTTDQKLSIPDKAKNIRAYDKDGVETRIYPLYKDK